MDQVKIPTAEEALARLMEAEEEEDVLKMIFQAAFENMVTAAKKAKETKEESWARYEDFRNAEKATKKATKVFDLLKAAREASGED